MNAPQYADGGVCGMCISGCFNDGSEKCFKAIVDNKCPECKSGDLDMGESGDGRWPLSWSFIPCPESAVKVSAQGSNPHYAKIKFEGGPSAIESCTCDGKSGQATHDGYFVFMDNGGKSFCEGMGCELKYKMGGTKSVPVGPGVICG
jgi:hypothetical protein